MMDLIFVGLLVWWLFRLIVGALTGIAVVVLVFFLGKGNGHSDE